MTLDDYMIREDLTNAAFASMIGRSEATVWRIRYGEDDPSATTARAIVRATRGAVTHNDLFGRKRA
jgi:DNA-binding transcriptional regulator YdaS (Cro superfamily)